MFRPGWKFLVVGAVVIAAISVSASEANAFWGWRCYRPAACWYSPCYSIGCGSPYCGGYYVGLRRGPIRRLLLGPYRWYYGGYGCCYSSCCCWDCCSYDVACRDSVSVCGAVAPTPAAVQKVAPAPAQPAPAPAQAAPAQPAPALMQPAPSLLQPKVVPDAGALEAPTDAPPAKQPDPTSLLPGETRNQYQNQNQNQDAPTRATSGLLTIWVPAGAKVTINGIETKSMGSRRQYVSYGLKPGFTYKYVVRAQIVRNGKLAEETKTVHLTAGAREGVAFGFNPRPDEELAASF